VGEIRHERPIPESDDGHEEDGLILAALARGKAEKRIEDLGCRANLPAENKDAKRLAVGVARMASVSARIY
jgi:hypothetical protein